MPAEESSPAVVLRARAYGEADRIVTLLTQTAGRLTGIAKGIRTSLRRFERRLEPFTHALVYFRRRPSSELVFLTRAEAAGLPSYGPFDELTKFALGCYMLELAEAFTPEHAEAAGCYHLLTESLTVVDRGPAGAGLRQVFELRLLAWAGYQLDFASCRRCHAAPGEGAVFFVESMGGVLCPNCLARSNVSGLRLGAASAQALSALAAHPLAEVGAADAAPSDGQAALERFIASLLGRPPRSALFLATVLADTL
ncbi:MAG: DNA repair protein RecO [Deltaproteobacteria bacterium]|nr:DNA repair protein RecO [Deltaproteobacteria bacterium]